MDPRNASSYNQPRTYPSLQQSVYAPISSASSSSHAHLSSSAPQISKHAVSSAASLSFAPPLPSSSPSPSTQRQGVHPVPIQNSSQIGGHENTAESHETFNQLLKTYAQGFQRVKKEVESTPPPLLHPRKTQELNDLMHQKWHLEYLKRYVDTSFTTRNDPEFEAIEVPEFSAELIHLPSTEYYRPIGGPVYVLDVMKRRYHPSWGFFPGIRVKISSDMKLSVQINLRTYVSEVDVVSFFQIADLMQILSIRSGFVACDGVPSLSRLYSEQATLDDFKRFEFPEPDIGFHHKCETWFHPAPESRVLGRFLCRSCLVQHMARLDDSFPHPQPPRFNRNGAAAIPIQPKYAPAGSTESSFGDRYVSDEETETSDDEDEEDRGRPIGTQIEGERDPKALSLARSGGLDAKRRRTGKLENPI